MRVCIYLLIIFFLIFSFTGNVKAHGSGPPFFKINGKYAQTNLLYLGIPEFRFPISQDNTPEEKYLVNKDIEFEIDTSQLLVPQEIVRKSTFRWTWEKDSKDYTYGTKQSHRYSKIGSKLITIEVKSPDITEFVAINTVLIHVVPNDSYKLPKIEIVKIGNNQKLNQPVTFGAKVEEGTSSIKSKIWFLDQNTYKENEDFPIYTYTQATFTNFVFLEAQDEQGFLIYDGVQVNSNEGTLRFIDLVEKEDIKSVERGEVSREASVLPYIIGVGGFGLLSLGAILFLRRNK